MGQPQPLKFSEIESYFNLWRTYYEDWELKLILQFDNIALEHFAKEANKQNKSSKAKKR